MSKLAHNPFHYGKPVPPERFIGREDVLRTIFARINNGESTTIIGAPHIGKSSSLRYIRDAGVQAAWLGDATRQYTFIDIDCHLLSGSYQPVDFWHEVLDRIAEAFSEETILKQLAVVRQSAYGSFTLKRLFDLLARGGLRAVLLIDEFDVLLYHTNFNTAEFFGALRSLSTLTEGLSLVTASRLSIAEMNRRSHEINPLGSPFFNNFTEVRLLPLHPTETDKLLDHALKGTRISFSQEDRAYIKRMSGRHPYLVQATAAALFDAITQRKQRRAGEEQYDEVSKALHRSIAAHFEDLWRHLSPEAQTAMHILALAQSQESTEALGKLEQYDSELRLLADSGLIEPVDDERHLAWRGRHWRISAECFAQWIAESSNARPRGSLQAVDTERAKQVATLRELRDEHRKRLHERQLQEAKCGIGTDPAITNEIKEIEGKIADIERQLKQL